jgi:hypothetical protein
MQNQITKKQLRSFGLLVGAIFAGIGLWPVIFSREPRWWALILAVGLIVPAAVYPRSLFWIYKGWMAVGQVLGHINTRIILGLIFYVIVTPIGFVRRLLGKDPMGRQIRNDLDTYRTAKKARSPSHLMRQY